MKTDWILEIEGRPEISDPTWPQIKDILSAMDGDEYSIVILTRAVTKEALSVCGGNHGRYLVSYRSLGAPYAYVATDLSLDGPDEVELAVQIPDTFPSRWCIRLPPAV